MSLPAQTSIRVRNREFEWRFDWSEFDGDDCFGAFGITVSNQGKTSRFDFGGAVVRSLRKVAVFFQDESQATVGGGFRNPDIRTYDLHRCGADYRLIVSTDDGRTREEFRIEKPEMFFDDRFLKEYYDHED